MSFAAAAGTLDPREELARELQRVVTRVQALGAARLAAHSEPARRSLEILADAAWLAEQGGPGRPALPHLPPHALADQLTLLTRDLLDATTDATTETVALREATEALASLRRALP